ncbi:MAG TPA: hypothetical protein PKG76_16065 [Acidobacteriota bacterium]|nr:hypothetical protein [Acidobacteriota bacterium]
MSYPIITLNDEAYVTASDFSVLVGVDPCTVWKWARKGLIQTAKLKGLRLVRLDREAAAFRELRQRARKLERASRTE